MKIALLSGAHSHTAGYLREIRENPEIELVCVWDDMPSRGREIAEEMGCEFVADLDAAVTRDDLDMTVICADNHGHRPLVEASCAAGVDLFCEKPMAVTLEDADAMLRAIRGSGRLAVFGYFQPFTGAALAAKRLLDQGKLGAVSQLRYRNSHHAAYGHWFDSEDRRWFTQPEKSGGGAFLDMGTHAIHFVRTLFGPVKTVTASIANKSGVYPDVDDFGIALLEFESGATGIIEASWVFTGGPGGLEAVGSGGCLEVDGEVRFTPFTDRAGETEAVPEEAPQPSRLGRLIALKRGDLDPATAAADLDCCRDAVAIVAACYESARTGQRQAVSA